MMLRSILTLAVAAVTAQLPIGAQSLPANSREPNAPQSPRAERALGFYDHALRRVVMVGGQGQPPAGERFRIWSWTGTRWELVPDSGTYSRGNAGVAYDGRQRRAVVTGGATRSASDSTKYEIVADTWEGKPTGWQRITGADIGPRDHLSMVYDESREAILMFGGILGDRSLPWPSDTWELQSQGWVRLATEGPSGRGRTALVYDSKRNQVVLFGGVGGAPPGQPQPFFNDTWVWEKSRWRNVSDNGPRARYAHGMVFDERAGVVLLYSGAAAHRDAPLSDMWKWDGQRWTEIPLTGPTPGHRYQPLMVYDRARGKTVLYGGGRDDTWEWDGRQWKEIRP